MNVVNVTVRSDQRYGQTSGEAQCCCLPLVKSEAKLFLALTAWNHVIAVHI
jgi:hypothetical protein